MHGTAAAYADSMTSPPKLLDRVRTTIRTRHYSRRTEQAYVGWIRRFILFHQKRHPSEMGASEIGVYLSWLAESQHVSASTQNQALSAVMFLYRDVLGIDVGRITGVTAAKVPHRLPVVLTRAEVSRLLQELTDPFWSIAALLYGAGLRLNECLGLRVKDLDFERSQIAVRRGKGGKDRVTLLPRAVHVRLSEHLERVREMHTRDLKSGFGRVMLPEALARKYPNADREWRWQFVFPAARICRDPKWGPPSRFHLHESAVQRAIAGAARRAHLTKCVGPHTLRHHADCLIMPTLRWAVSTRAPQPDETDAVNAA